MSVTPEPHSQSIGKLVISALKSLVVGSIALGVLLFLPAGTLNYWQAWVLISVFVPGSIATGIYLRLHDPELLERRKQVGPMAGNRPAQKFAISGLILAISGMRVLSALDHWFGWCTVPAPLSLVGSALTAIALYITFPRLQGEQLQRLPQQRTSLAASLKTTALCQEQKNLRASIGGGWYRAF
jgi:hypothetical protein